MPPIDTLVTDLARQGYAKLAVSSWLVHRTLYLVAQLHRRPAEFRQAMTAASHRSLFGYMPDEGELESWTDGGAFPATPYFATGKRRNYATFDWALDSLAFAPAGLVCHPPRLNGELVAEVAEAARALEEVTRAIGTALLSHAACASSCFTPQAVEGPTCSTFRALNYRAGQGSYSKAHADYELVSLVLASGPGLEVQDAAGAWQSVTCGEDCAILLAGEMLHLASGGLIRPAVHRVRLGAERHAAILFHGLRYQTTLACPDGRPLVFGEHLVSRFIMGRPDLLDAYDRQEIRLPFALCRENPFRG